MLSNLVDIYHSRLKPEARPISNPEDPTVLTSVADARCMFFPTISAAQEIWIKGQNFSIAKYLAVAIALILR